MGKYSSTKSVDFKYIRHLIHLLSIIPRESTLAQRAQGSAGGLVTYKMYVHSLSREAAIIESQESKAGSALMKSIPLPQGKINHT